MDVHDYHQGNTAGLWARWSSECVHTALRRTRLVPCTAEQILQDSRHHDWLNIWLDQLAAELETEGTVPGHLGNLGNLKGACMHMHVLRIMKDKKEKILSPFS